MRKLSLSILLLAAAPAFGQLESHTLAISASRSIHVQPDQAVFGLSVSSSAATNLDQIVSALSGLGITAANLSGVNNNSAPSSFQWNFTLAVPLSNLTATIGSIAKLEQTIAQNNSGLTLAFNINGTEVSQQLQQSPACSNSDLIADATAQAGKLAAAAGLTLGPILGLSNSPLLQPFPAPAGIALVGSFSSFLLAAPSPPVSCSLVVEFQLLP